MRAGKLRHRVTIQRFIEDTDDLNTPTNDTTEWQDVATVWAAVEPLRGREFIQLHSMESELTTRIRIRYRSGITPGMRILYGTRIFDIQSVIDIEERHREMHLMCVEEGARSG